MEKITSILHSTNVGQCIYLENSNEIFSLLLLSLNFRI